MANELHIHIRTGVVAEPEDLLDSFPFEEGQSIMTFTGDLIVVDLGEADDTNYIQDWFLNSSDDVQSYYIVGE